MRQVKNSLMLLLAGLSVASCATTPERPRLASCLTDPKNDSMHCDGQTYPYSEMFNYVCHRLDDFETFLRSCK